MLGDIDLTKKIVLPQLYACKPDRTTVAKLYDSFNISLKLKLGNVDELLFDLPYEVELQHKIQTNPNISKLKDRYLIRLEYGELTEWFIIDSPSINVEDEKNYKQVQCYSLAYELRDKILHTYATQVQASDGSYIDSSFNATQVMNDALADTLWNIGYVDASFDAMYRSFSETSITSLDLLLKIADTFQGVLRFDTEKREVSLYAMNSIGTNRGLTLSEGHYTKSMKKELQKDSFCTRLKVYGKSGLSIDAVNPTGSEYLEDFSYFLYPYQEDANGNVIQSSDYMSNGLCHAILEYNKKVVASSGLYANLLSQLTTLQDQLTTDQNTMSDLQNQLVQLQDSLDTANATNNVYYGVWNATTNYVPNNVVTYNGAFYKAIGNNIDIIPTTANNTVWLTSDGTGNTTIQGQINTLSGQISSQQNVIDADNANINSIEYTITVNSGVTKSGNVTFTIDGTNFVVALHALDTATIVANKLSVAFNQNYPTYKATVSNNVVVLDYFTSQSANLVHVSFVDTDTTGTTASISSRDKGVLNQVSSLQANLAIENNFTPSQIKERNQYVVEKEYSDTNVDVAQDLYNAGLLAFEKMKTPNPQVTIDIVNFLEIVECQHDWDKLNLGDTVTIYYPQYDTNVEALIVEIDFNFDEDGGTSSNDNECQITISNYKNILTDEQRLLDLLYKSTGTSTTVDMSKYKWDDTVASMSQVQQILQNTWDANARAITAGTNESVKIDNRGIRITDPNDPLNYLVGLHSILAITNDGGQTWKNALTKDGLVAERLFGEVIMGENLTISSDDGLLQFIGNKGIIYDRNNHEVMALGLYDTINGVDQFGVKLFGQNATVYLDQIDGFKINKLDGTEVAWLDTTGNLHLDNIYATGNIDATTFSINGKNVLTSDGLFLDGANIKNINADTIVSGQVSAHIVTVTSQLAGGGEIVLDSNGLRAYDSTGKETVNIGSSGGVIVGAEIDSAPDGNARIQLKGNTFTGLTSDDKASGLKFIVNSDGTTDIGLYHEDVKYINFKDGGSFFAIEPTSDASYLGLGASSMETRCYGTFNFYDNIISMHDDQGNEKFKIYTTANSSGVDSNPVIQMGLGVGNGDNGKVKIVKTDVGLEIDYITTNGQTNSFKLDENGINLNHEIGSYIQLDNSGNINFHAVNNMNFSHGGTLDLDA